MKNIFSIMTCALMLALAGTSSAKEPVKLTDVQMDGVTAGAFVLLQGNATAIAQGAGAGTILSQTNSETFAQVDTTADPQFAAAAAGNTSLGQSVAIGTPGGPVFTGAAAQSASQAAAQLQ
ncbi:putative hemagglutinin-related autotransporter protein [Nitrosococcus halophilus Nc 4]|uniref:Hemagglutinin-related autotransporter protein n=1 Tax=Nitrosococcus halophilus (strain Nc4) TaxID=472759 RepID=D5C4T0_NITHN|nr:hypothetical protein [Nitrosococcus halophilus]ADE13353.1 putative hemagglutinin-related autotransporter protein [Nitrosococcus halophilus Nc 4]